MHVGLVLTPSAAVGAAAALAVTAPSPSEALRVLSSTAQATDLGAPLVAAASLLAWALVTQLLAVVALTLTAHLPGTCGRTGHALLRRSAPADLRRVVAVALGVGLALGPGASVAAAATTAGAAQALAPAVSTGGPAPALAPASLDWPSSPAAPAGRTPASSAPATAHLDWPVDERPAPDAPSVVVAPGDSLWALAASALPDGATDQQVAQAWPTWWSANRALIGEDPDLLHPGQSLHAPR